MKVLAIDTSSNIATVAVMDDMNLISETILNHKKTHSQKLMPIIKHTLEDSELQISDIDIISVATGPGSFTGLRIGIATAKAIAHSMNKPIVGVPTLDALALSVPFFNGIVCPIMDARNNQVFTSLYKWNGSDTERISDYLGIDIYELLDMIKQKNENVVFLGDGINAFKQTIQEKLSDRAFFANKSNSSNRASLVAEIGIRKYNNGEVDNYITLSPFYLRKSQAERLHQNTKTT